MNGPSPDDTRPMRGFPQVGFLKPLVKNPNIVVGEYTYYDDPDGPERFEKENVLYHFPFIGDRLVIGRFCAIAKGAKFVMNGANHAMGGFSTFPFFIFAQGWEVAAPKPGELPYKGGHIDCRERRMDRVRRDADARGEGRRWRDRRDTERGHS